MTRVSVVGTVHEPKGAANVAALLGILERIGPEIVFLESPSAAFHDYLASQRTLEATAVTRYQLLHRVDLIPVDLPTPETDFFRHSRELHMQVERTSPEFRRLVDRHTECVVQRGFEYLNSKDCSDFFSELHRVMLTAIAKLPDQRVAEWYNHWTTTDEQREKAMMKHIEQHLRANAPHRAAFLVGAAHRQSIIDLSRAQTRADCSDIEWEFIEFSKDVPASTR